MTLFSRILVPVDLGGDPGRAMEFAAGIAQRFDAEVVLLHLRPSAPAASGTALRAAEEALEDHRLSLERAGLRVRRISRVLEIPTVTAAEVIVEAAGRERADLVVMATHGRRGLARVLLGSVTEEVLRHAPCPVLAVRIGDEPT